MQAAETKKGLKGNINVIPAQVRHPRKGRGGNTKENAWADILDRPVGYAGGPEEKLFLKGERCFTPRCAIERRRSAPGEQSRRRRRPSDYGVHLLEKQKAKYIYGVLESQFRKYMAQAFDAPGVTGLNLLRSLERRLDNVIFLLGFADSRKQARQMVLHSHFQVNGKRTDIPSYQVDVGDVISWKESDKTTDYFAERDRRHSQAACAGMVDVGPNGYDGQGHEYAGG